VRGRLHHLISLKIKDKLHIFDYATDNKPFELGATICHINANKNFKYVLEFSATKVENIETIGLVYHDISPLVFFFELCASERDP
jgi:hypothetical protein